MLPAPVTAFEDGADHRITRSRDCKHIDKMYPVGYGQGGVAIRQTEVFSAWLGKLRDRKARARIQARLDRLALGNPGDTKPVGKKVIEMKIDYGPGYRVYYTQRGKALVILLCGGDKRTQRKDIQRAMELARNI